MGRQSPQVRNAHRLHSICDALDDERGWHTPYGECPGDVVFYHGCDDLVIWILEDHADHISYGSLISLH